MDTTARPATTTTFQWVGMVNRPVLFRRALKLINGGNVAGASVLPSPGLTIASENPVYVFGNYNASAGTVALGVDPDEPHMAAAILADSVTLVETERQHRSSGSTTPCRQRNGGRSTHPAPLRGRRRQEPHFRIQHRTPQFLFGTDGGVGNFLRLLADWRTGPQVRHRGSIVSLFISRQATGTSSTAPRLRLRQPEIQFRRRLPAAGEAAAGDADVPRRQHAHLQVLLRPNQ
jgi:hypothetical protein